MWTVAGGGAEAPVLADGGGVGVVGGRAVGGGGGWPGGGRRGQGGSGGVQEGVSGGPCTVRGPVGGLKQAGRGRGAGVCGLEEFLEEKSLQLRRGPWA